MKTKIVSELLQYLVDEASTKATLYLESILRSIKQSLISMSERIEKLEQQPCACSGVGHIIREQNQRVDKVDERMQKLEEANQWDGTHWKDLLSRIEKLESTIDVANHFGAKDIRDIKQVIIFITEQADKVDERIEKLDNALGECRSRLNIQREELSGFFEKQRINCRQIENLQASIFKTDQRLAASILKRVNDDNQIESLHAQLAQLTTELRNYRMQNSHLQHQIDILQNPFKLFSKEGAD